MTVFSFSRRRLATTTTIVACLAAATFFLPGCGGSSSDNGNSTPAQAQFSGNAAVKAAAVTAVQSLAAGISFPLAALKDTAPAGSPLVTGKIARKPDLGPLVYDPTTMLYKSYTVSGPTETIAYFTDAAGTLPAGTSIITDLMQGTTAATTYTNNYTSYPVTISASGSVTLGALPLTGTVNITYTGPSAANTIKGHFTLPKNNIVGDGTMSLDAAQNVTGNFSLTAAGQTMQVSSIAGNITGTLTADLTLSPQGWTGTGTFNLQTGAMSFALKTDKGTATATTDSTGSLNLTYADGTKETVTTPITTLLNTINNTGTTSTTTTGTTTGTGTGGTGGGTTIPGGYAVTDLGRLPGTFGSYSTAINSSGQTIGYCINQDNNQQYGFLYSGGKMTALGALPGDADSIPNGINDSGQVVGDSIPLSGGVSHAFLYSNGQMTSLGTLPGDTVSTADAINASGQVVGTSSGPNRTRIFLYSNGKMTSLGTPPGLGSVQVHGINASGQIAGGATAQYASDLQAFLYSGGFSNIARLAQGTSNVAYAINTSGQVVGYSGAYGGDHTFLYSNGGVSDLGTIQKQQDGSARIGINDLGQVVGDGRADSISTGTYYGFLYSNGQRIDLNTRTANDPNLLFLYSASGINNKGQICGYGSFNEGNSACILTPK